MVMFAISSVFLTSGVLVWTTHFVYPAIFLVAMGLWGLYYEFLSFGISQFVSKNAPVTERSGMWSMIGVFKSIAYTIGPLFGSWLFLLKGDIAVISAYIGFGLVAYLIWMVLGIRNGDREQDRDLEVERFNMWEEIKYWHVLFDRIWPILLVSLTFGIIDAAFWTTGVVLSDNLVKGDWLGALFVPAYILPSIFVGFVVSRLGIYKGKNKLAEIFLLLTGIFTIGMGLGGSVWIMVLLSFMIGVSTAIAWPFVDAVYSDIATRMGREQKHVYGISSSTVNLSYITGPVIAGFIAQNMGEEKALMFIGIFVVLVSIMLLVVTPKKLRLPQNEIKTWN
jgi:MFS family permease